MGYLSDYNNWKGGRWGILNNISWGSWGYLGKKSLPKIESGQLKWDDPKRECGQLKWDGGSSTHQMLVLQYATIKHGEQVLIFN